MKETIAFVGAGLASVTAIERLRTEGYDGGIQLFSEEDRLPYDRPPLSKEVLTGEAPDRTPLRPESFYADNDVDLRLGTGIDRIEPGTGRLRSRTGETFTATATVLATGGSARTLPVPGANLRGVVVLRTHQDAIALRDRMVDGARMVVIGGGFIGTEVAAAAVARGMDTTLLEAQPAPLAAVLPGLAPHIVDYHRSRGVRIRTGIGVEAITGVDRVTGVRLSDGEIVPADTVVVGIGMVPNDALAAEAGLPTGNGIHVDRDLATAAPGVYAIGDVAAVQTDPGVRRRIEHWQNAIHHGEHLAARLVGRDSPPPAVPWFWSDQFDLNIQMVGEPGHTDEQIWRGDPGTGSCTVLFRRDGRLSGAIAMNRGRDIRPLTELVRGGYPVDTEHVASPETDLRKFARGLTRAATAPS